MICQVYFYVTQMKSSSCSYYDICNQRKWSYKVGRWVGEFEKIPTSFSPVTSTNVGVTPQNFWLLLLNFLPHWCKISRPHLVLVLNYWTWAKNIPQKKQFFWSNHYKIEVMITCLIECLELTNFSHMTTSTIKFE